MSIKAEELRLGNWIDTPKMGPSMVRLVTMHEGEYMVYHNQKDIDSFHNAEVLKNCMPVSLTEDWLKKAGFEYIRKVWQNNLIHGFLDTIGEFAIYYGKEYLRTIKHVHQLQNLYFALTGTELQFAPPSSEREEIKHR
jgi:hypothetical protein